MITNTPNSRFYAATDPLSGQFDSRLTNLFATPEATGNTLRLGARVGETLLDAAARAGLPVSMLESQDISMPLNARLMPGEVVTLSIGANSIEAVSVETRLPSHRPSTQQNAPRVSDPFASVDWRINLQANRAPQASADYTIAHQTTQDFGRGLAALSDYLDIGGYSLSGSLEIDGQSYPVQYG